LQNLDERHVLMDALHEKLRVRVQGPRELLCFYGRIPCVDPSEHTTFGRRATAEEVLARSPVLAIVAVGAKRAHAHAKEMLICKSHHDSKTVYSG